MSSTKRTPAHSAYNLPEAAAAEVAAAAAEATAAAADAPVPGSEAAAAEEDAPVPAVAEAVPTVVAEGATAVEAAAVAAVSGSGGAAAAAAEAGAVGYGLNLAGFGLANQSASESKNLADRIAEYQPEAIVSLLLGIKDFVDAAAIAAGSSAAAGRYALVRAIGWVIGGFAASRYYARSAKPCFAAMFALVTCAGVTELPFVSGRHRFPVPTHESVRRDSNLIKDLFASFV